MLFDRGAVRMRAAVFAAALACAAAGCHTPQPKVEPSPVNAVDRENPADSMPPLDTADFRRAAERIRVSRRPAVLPDRTYNILVLSGGGIYGAYPAGLLCGWTQAGDRPEF